LIILTLNDKSFWDYNNFDSEYIDGDEMPIIYNTQNWELFPNLENYSSNKGVELRNVILRSGIKFDYKYFGMEINASISLKGESSCWIFTRSAVKVPINKNNEDISHTDNSIVENTDSLFNRYTSVIKIYKEDKCQRCFVCLSIFAEDENGNKHFKTFSKRQLVNINNEKIKNKYYYENDICDMKVYLLDTGDDKITVRVTSNNNI
jgi:hypothetical protein